ncbi:MAG: DUF2099 family protein [Methanomicrobiales archaeon]|nr:DUF2099 family protein [Methanomicrobiales archaeon]
MYLTDEHVIETLGKTRIVIRGGSIAEIGEPKIRRCPLARRFSRPVHTLEPDVIRESVEARIQEMGMCTEQRELLSSRDFVTFGASELICTGLRTGLLDAGVIACDGAGTVIATSPELVQGIGGRMSGLIRTSPIEEVIRNIAMNGGRVCFPETATIDQGKGLLIAHDMGYRRVAVTVTAPETAEGIRRVDDNALIIGVHLTGLSEDEAVRLLEAADIVSACASRWIRAHAGRYAMVQAGASIPVFALTERGKELIMARLKEVSGPLFVKTSALPVGGEESPEPLV